MKFRNEGSFDFCLLILVSLHLYVRVYLTLLMYCGADEVTVEFECFYSNSESVTLSELQCTECRGRGWIMASGELRLLQSDSFDNQIPWQRIIVMDHMTWNLKRKEGIEEQETSKRQTEGGEWDKVMLLTSEGVRERVSEGGRKWEKMQKPLERQSESERKKKKARKTDTQTNRRWERRNPSLHPKHTAPAEERLVLTIWDPFDKHGYLNRNTHHILQTNGRIGLTFHSSFCQLVLAFQGEGEEMPQVFPSNSLPQKPHPPSCSPLYPTPPSKLPPSLRYQLQQCTTCFRPEIHSNSPVAPSLSLLFPSANCQICS